MTITAQIRLFSTKNQTEIWLYRTLGGDPNSILPSLRLLKQWIRTNKDRDVGEWASWLLYLGMLEYNMKDADGTIVNRDLMTISPLNPSTNRFQRAWRIGAYEPCERSDVCSDIEWFYEIDIDDASLVIGRPMVMIDRWYITSLWRDDESIPINLVIKEIESKKNPTMQHEKANFYFLLDEIRV